MCWSGWSDRLGLGASESGYLLGHGNTPVAEERG